MARKEKIVVLLLLYGVQEQELAHVYDGGHVVKVVDHAEVGNVVTLAQILCPVALTYR
jgi:inorganic pyrophosphatase/exopolyphosphatase